LRAVAAIEKRRGSLVLLKEACGALDVQGLELCVLRGCGVPLHPLVPVAPGQFVDRRGQRDVVSSSGEPRRAHAVSKGILVGHHGAFHLFSLLPRGSLGRCLGALVGVQRGFECIEDAVGSDLCCARLAVANKEAGAGGHTAMLSRSSAPLGARSSLVASIVGNAQQQKQCVWNGRERCGHREGAVLPVASTWYLVLGGECWGHAPISSCHASTTGLDTQSALQIGQQEG
jgi:hypothetical protein